MRLLPKILTHQNEIGIRNVSSESQLFKKQCFVAAIKEGGQTSTINRTDQTKRDKNVLKCSNESLELRESTQPKF